MRNGWIKIHRKILNNLIFENEKALKIWLWCLLEANHRDNSCLVGRQKIILKRGQFLFGSLKAKNELKMAIGTIWYWLNFFKSENQIKIKSTNKYSIITIINYNRYQQVENKVESTLNTNRQADGKQIENRVKQTRMYKNDKENKKKKPFFWGNPMPKAHGKWWVIVDGQWREFAGSEKDIECK